uniref:SH3 domain-binding glutamic acid-rich-like protein 2 n=1 Tax=Phallusia mammillata TaxID=59560 RepID=A0A6F9DSP6_9ASCI|nr:SH3 domain-binding glutamic acid-rich-like protein 2 [Phallusia mammillata]
MGGITVYVTSVLMNKCIRDNQNKIINFLNANNIGFEVVDLTINTEAREIMLAKMPESKKEGKVLPPQVFNGDEYCGDFEKFFAAMENGLLYTFFKLSPPSNSMEEKTLLKFKQNGIAMDIC